MALRDFLTLDKSLPQAYLFRVSYRNKFIVKSRSMTVPTRVYVRNSGYRDSVKFTSWKTLSVHTTYEDAVDAKDARPRVGLAAFAVFHCGKRYERRPTGELWGDEAWRH